MKKEYIKWLSKYYAKSMDREPKQESPMTGLNLVIKKYL